MLPWVIRKVIELGVVKRKITCACLLFLHSIGFDLVCDSQHQSRTSTPTPPTNILNYHFLLSLAFPGNDRERGTPQSLNSTDPAEVRAECGSDFVLSKQRSAIVRHSVLSISVIAPTTFPTRAHKHVNPSRAPTLSGPLNRLNAILSLLQPLDRYRTPSAIESAIGRPLSRIQIQVGVLNRLVLNRLGGSTAR